MQYVPRVLYKYRPLQSTDPEKDYDERLLHRLCGEILDKRLFASQPSKLNDPFEGAGVIPFASNAGASIAMNVGDLPPSAREFAAGFRLIALSELYDSPQMWAHYATGYCGACLCIDTTSIRSSVGAVRYSDEPIMVGGYDADELLEHRDAWAPSSLLVKQRDWAYEQEWRVIVREEETDGGFVSYGDGCLVAVILGHNCPEVAVSAVKGACRKLGVPVYVTAPQKFRYHLAIWPIDFLPSYDGRPIEQQISEYCKATGESQFGEWPYPNTGKRDRKRDRKRKL